LEHAPDPGASGASTLSPAHQPSPIPLWEHGLRVAARPSPALGQWPALGLSLQAEVTPAGGAAVIAPTPAAALPVLRVIGQFGGIYIISEGPDGMYLIDQHAAHERVLYEQFWRLRRDASPQVQALLEPMAVEVSPRQRALLAEESQPLAEHGFELEPFGNGAYLLRALPSALADGDARQALLRFLDTMLEEEGEGDHRDRVAMSLASHGAIRAGKTLAMEEMRELVSQLEESGAPHTCPHGRPTMIHMSAELLARAFGRR
ncbi:MAG: hypothetical protein ACRDH5_19405, partial [bacterium]